MHNGTTRLYERQIREDFSLRHEVITHADGHKSSPFKARVKETIRKLRNYRKFLEWSTQQGYKHSTEEPDFQGRLF